MRDNVVTGGRLSGGIVKCDDASLSPPPLLLRPSPLTPTGGQLVTVFSAPDYPHFKAPGAEEHTPNKTVVVQLKAPGWDMPGVVQFEAALPRPKVGGMLACVGVHVPAWR